MKHKHKTLLWLASYPKSGNTWLRLFLLNYLLGRDDAPVPINQAARLGPSDATAALYRKAASSPVDLLDHEQSLKLRPSVLKRHASGGADVNFMKTHCRNTRIGKTSLIPQELTRGAVYILRDPRDIVPSYADHYGLSLVDTAARIAHPDNAVLADPTVVTQYLGTWSDHARSWADETRFPVCVIRYEDLQSDPVAQFQKILTFIGIPKDDARRDRAISAASFDRVRKEEEKSGFVEKSAGGTRFFRSGKVGGWRDTLAPELARRIEEDHGDVMRRFGYLE